MNETKKLQRLIKIQEREITRLMALVDRDFLTGLYNREGFMREAEKFLKQFEFKNIKEKRKMTFKSFSLVFIDIDNLKIINDNYGHKEGDALLKKAGAIFQESVREIDIVSRWGGDEFIVGLVGANEAEAMNVAKKLKAKLKSVKINGSRVSASFGVISLLKGVEKEEVHLSDLIEKADMAMYEAKKKLGKDFVVPYHKINPVRNRISNGIKKQ